MAIMRNVNQYIKANYPRLDIEAVKGAGYVYFDGADGFDKIPSLYVMANAMNTCELADLCLESIQDVYGAGDCYVKLAQ